MSTLRIVVRRLLAEPAFTAIAALTFSIGIGANLVVFTVVNTILLQQLPVPDSERLVILGHEPAGELHRPGQPQRVDAARVTASFFDVVQTLAQLGRTIQAEDERPDAPAVVLLSDEL